MCHWITLGSQTSSEHLRQADLSMLALRVVTARVLVILNGSFMSQIEAGLALTWFSDDYPIHKGYTVLIVESQVITSDISGLLWLGVEPRLPACNGGCSNSTLHYPCLLHRRLSTRCIFLYLLYTMCVNYVCTFFVCILAELPSGGERHSPVLVHLKIGLHCFSMSQKYL